MSLQQTAIFNILIFLSLSLPATDVAVESIYSKAMSRNIPLSVVLPSAYKKNTKKRFPVVYLLHGAGDQHGKWLEATHVKSLAERDDVIVVCPDGGFTSWYFDSPIDPTYQYETFISQELIEYVDSHYRTISVRDQRAIAGNSMGGHGALFLAMRHKATFGAAVSFSGGVDIRPFFGNWDISKRLGDIAKNRKLWEKMTVINIARQLKPRELALSLTCGKKDFFLEVNRQFHRLLIENNIDHHYKEGEGGHDWIYWKGELDNQWHFLMDFFHRYKGGLDDGAKKKMSSTI